MAKANIDGEIVTFEEGRVHCANPEIQRLADLLTMDVPYYEEEPENQRALLAVKELGGFILELDPPDEEGPPGTIH